MRKQNFFLLLMSLVVIVSCTTTSKNQKENNFVRVENGQFIRNGKPYYYIGTNFWYGAILGSEGEGGNRVRLCRELDSLKSIGIDNLRILVGSDGERGVAAKVEPTLQEFTMILFLQDLTICLLKWQSVICWLCFI